MNINRTLKSKQIMKCQRCGGQIMRHYDEVGCLQCGAVHTKDGFLETINSMNNLINIEVKRGTPVHSRRRIPAMVR